MYEAIASVYDRWMTHMDYEAIQARLLELLDGRPEGRPVLDICTGTGSVLLQLARSGAVVMGLDRSAEMLELATRKIERAGVAERASVRCLDAVGDEEWPPGPYDLVLCVGDSVNYFDGDELRRFVDRASRVLSDAGALYVDVNSVFKLCHVFGSSIHTEEFDGCAYIWRNQLQVDRTSIDFDITLFKQESRSGEHWTRHTEHHRQYVHELPSILELLRNAGLTDVSVTEDFAGHAEPTAESLRWVIVARRPGGHGQ